MLLKQRYTTTMRSIIAILFLLMIGCQSKNAKKDKYSKDKEAIAGIHERYVEGWKNMNEEEIMSLFEDDSRIQPNTLAPVQGKVQIQAFWFPKDSSVTTIHKFDTHLIGIEVNDTIAVSTYNTYLDWSYQKDSTAFGMAQKDISTTLYRKQQDTTWAIWRQMWTDIYEKRKPYRPPN